MKQFITAFLAVLYISTSAGMTVHLHYCMDKLVSVGLGQVKNKTKCNNCGMKLDNNSCCKDTHQQVKNTQDQKTETPTNFHFIVDAPLSLGVMQDKTPLLFTQSLFTNKTAAPPDVGKLPLFIQQCVFRI